MSRTPSRPDFDARVAKVQSGGLTAVAPTTLQLNIGYRCNLACHHCHVESGPRRTEAMDRRGIERVVELLAANPAIDTLDLTGGAPELHPEFRHLVEAARELERHVIDRCNLTVLFEPGQEDTADFLARNRVEVIASLPCYTAERVDGQRGRGVFEPSIRALKLLNGLGYGAVGSPLLLHLIYNPGGATLPPDQCELEARYREELRAQFGIEFHSLYTLTNMPIQRFARELERTGQAESYFRLLEANFNPATLPSLMCRSQLSVDWRGRLYDCDFNQALDLPLDGGEGDASEPLTIFTVDDLADLAGRSIATGAHCFGCTAGAGSSCGGSLS